ncbi:histidine kinase dimerization/phosphoacceptor domain -containing protein [Humitalea rosea]|nr:sensor histidine kinase [Humitalea rosea]
MLAATPSALGQTAGRVPQRISFEACSMTPQEADALLASRRHGAHRQDATVAAYRQAMIERQWILNGMPLIISRSGVLLDGVQRLLACCDAGVAFPTFVARDVDDDVLHTIDQHRRRSLADILGARGVPNAHALMALMIRLMRYEDGSLVHGLGPSPSWARTQRILGANPSLEQDVATSLQMAGSPLPEPVRTAIVHMGYRVDQAKTERLLQAVRYPEAFPLDDPGALLRLEIDRLREDPTTMPSQTKLFALAIKALNALLRDEKLRRIAWVESPGTGRPAEDFPQLDSYPGLIDPGPEASLAAAEGSPATSGHGAVLPGQCQVSLERIDQQQAGEYLAMNVTERGLIKTHMDGLARDMAAGRWMLNAQPICFSRSGRLINGQHRLMAVVAARGSIEVPVIRGLPEEAYATYDIQAKRPPPVEDPQGSFGDQALAAAMANLLWRQERRSPATRSKKATTAEIRQILLEFPRLLELRGFGRRMVAYGRASVMGYGAFVIEREDPAQAGIFLRALDTGADLPGGHPILTLRTQMQRLRRERASQEEQLAALLNGWQRYKAHAAACDGPHPAVTARIEAGDRARVRAVALPVLDRAVVAPRPAVDAPPDQPPSPILAPYLAQASAAAPYGTAADATAELLRRTRQQSMVAGFGRIALRGGDQGALMQEAARLAAEGVRTALAMVLQHDPATDTLVLRAGIGWRAGVVGHTRLPVGPSSPAGFAFATRTSIVCNDLAAERRFGLSTLLAEHGVRRQANVLIEGAGAPFGVLEVDHAADGAFSSGDISFLAALANILALGIERGREAAQRDRLMAERPLLLAEGRHRVRDGLQLVHTILTLEAHGVESLAARRVLDTTARRIMGVAAVYERLDHTDTPVDIGAYLAGVVEALRAGLDGRLPRRRIGLDVEPGVTVPPNRLQVLGLLLAELLSTALGRGGGDIRVRFARTPTGARLEVENEETGLEPLPDPEPSADVGMHLIATLLQEQGGVFTLTRDGPRTRFIAAFPLGAPPS